MTNQDAGTLTKIQNELNQKLIDALSTITVSHHVLISTLMGGTIHATDFQISEMIFAVNWISGQMSDEPILMLSQSLKDDMHRARTWITNALKMQETKRGQELDAQRQAQQITDAHENELIEHKATLNDIEETLEAAEAGLLSADETVAKITALTFERAFDFTAMHSRQQIDSDLAECQALIAEGQERLGGIIDAPAGVAFSDDWTEEDIAAWVAEMKSEMKSVMDEPELQATEAEMKAWEAEHPGQDHPHRPTPSDIDYQLWLQR